MVMDKNVKDETSVVEIPFIKGWIFPVECIYKNLKSFGCLAGVFSFLVSLVALCLGRGLACGFGLTGVGVYCFDTSWSVLGSGSVLFLSLAMFINRWWLIAFNNVPFNEAIKEKKIGNDLKTVGFMFLFLIAIAVVGGGFYFLYSRKATPNLDLELGLFVLVSLVIIAGVLFLVNAVVFIRFLEGKNWFVFKKTFVPVFDNVYKLLAWFLFYMFLFIYLLRQVSILFAFCRKFLPLLLSSFIGDFAMYFVFYLLMACFVSLLQFQIKYIFADESLK